MMKMTMTMFLTATCTIKREIPLIILPTPKFGRLSPLPITYPCPSIHHECGSCPCCLLLLVLQPICFSPYDTLALALLLLLRYCLFTLLVCSGTKSSNDQMTPKKPLSMAAKPALHCHLTHLGSADSDSILPRDAGTRKSTAVYTSAAMCRSALHLLQMSVKHMANLILCANQTPGYCRASEILPSRPGYHVSGLAHSFDSDPWILACWTYKTIPCAAQWHDLAEHFGFNRYVHRVA